LGVGDQFNAIRSSKVGQKIDALPVFRATFGSDTEFAFLGSAAAAPSYW